jgi:TPP-dependent pyruvate/acetoin dehydrogenase alpha subunit
MSINLSAVRFGATTAETDTSKSAAKAAATETEDAFLTEAKKTPGERIREQILKKMGMSEDDLARLDDTARTAVEEAIKQEILRQARQSGSAAAGFLADVTA